MSRERIDIKDFKGCSKFRFIEGIFKKVERNLEGKEIEFYNLDKDGLEKLSMEKDSDIDENIDNIAFLYKLIPLVSNIDMTIDIKGFESMCKIPSLQFANFIDMLMEHIEEMFSTANKLNSIENKVKDFAVENNIELLQQSTKSKEEIIDELYEKLHDCKDREKIKEIMSEITKLEDDKIG